MPQMHTYIHKNVAVLGFGIEGQSVVRWLVGQHADVTVFDEKKPRETAQHTLDEFHEQVSYVFGPFGLFDRFDEVVVSPGIRHDRPEIVRAKQKGVYVTTATNMFLERTPCKTIGVTGTKGKGTTSSLIYEMLKADGKDAYVGGNIGTPPLDFLNKLTPLSIVVLELSSFQLMTIEKSPDIAVILMTTSEHLDVHKDIKEYVDAKAGIVTHQDRSGQIVVAVDYPNSLRIAQYGRTPLWEVSTHRKVTRGCFIKDREIFWTDGKTVERIASVSDIYIPGRHNWENAVAASAASKLAGASSHAIIKAIKSFQGLPHRIEFVREIDGVRYYNDSFSTTPETAIAAIRAFEEPKIVILGGSSKNSDFTELGRVIGESTTIRAIIGIGVEWKRMKEKITNNAVPAGRQELRIMTKEGCKDMKEIVETARSVAKPGDVVILSPACASFDMFNNYKDRGEQFREQVNALK